MWVCERLYLSILQHTYGAEFKGLHVPLTPLRHLKDAEGVVVNLGHSVGVLDTEFIAALRHTIHNVMNCEQCVSMTQLGWVYPVRKW